jgi:hypothetical protein
MITVTRDEFRQGIAHHIWHAGAQIVIIYNSSLDARIDLDVIQYITSMMIQRVKVSYVPNSMMIYATIL